MESTKYFSLSFGLMAVTNESTELDKLNLERRYAMEIPINHT
jgi:hypothetical protein